VKSPAYETRDTRARPLVALGAAFGLLVVLVLLVVRFGFPARDDSPGGEHPMASWRAPATGPRLEARPTLEFEAQRARDRVRLETWGWVDQQAGIARIPIERAVQLLLERGLPVREESKR
jgi:hypothetical protein